ncbi:MAG: hypothetical protein M1833_002216 [Piccolia ochrophora]|nr:MAG: hypothetical protein M1833_002216 [Piccolia ochrophora]
MKVSCFLLSAAWSAFASAYTQPVGDTPSGNPISKPGLNEVVPVNQPFTIEWDVSNPLNLLPASSCTDIYPKPTTPGTVTLLLLRGPSENVKPLFPIAEKIPNQGSYIWTPGQDLEPDTTRYGIQLIVDETGAYQYTSQFGISNNDYKPSSTSSTSSSSASASASSVIVLPPVLNGTVYYYINGTNCTSVCHHNETVAVHPPYTTTSTTAATPVVVSPSSAVAPPVANTPPPAVAGTNGSSLTPPVENNDSAAMGLATSGSLMLVALSLFGLFL